MPPDTTICCLKNSEEYKNITVNIDVPGLKGYTVQCYRLVGEGAAISGKVSHSVIFYNVVVEEGAQVTNSVILPGTVVEKDAVIDRAIIGERCRICAGVQIQGTNSEVAVYGNDETIKAERKGKGAK